jgi:hypothetical protein
MKNKKTAGGIKREKTTKIDLKSKEKQHKKCSY